MLQNIKQAYQILGIPEYASKEEIKKAYRTLCKKFHPDRNSASDAVKYYIEVQQAYEMIEQMEQYHEKNSKLTSDTPYGVFYKNAKMAEGKTMWGMSSRQQFETKNSSQANAQFCERGKILGGTQSYIRKYEEIQQRSAQKRKLERERERKQKEKIQKEREDLAARIRARKLPSEKEAEKREKIAIRKEAERIAGIIEKLMKL